MRVYSALYASLEFLQAVDEGKLSLIVCILISDTNGKWSRSCLLRNVCMALLITIKPRACNGLKMSAAAAQTISSAPSPTSFSFVLFWKRSCTSVRIPMLFQSRFCSSKRYLSCWHPPTDVLFAVSTGFVYLTPFRRFKGKEMGGTCSTLDWNINYICEKTWWMDLLGTPCLY